MNRYKEIERKLRLAIENRLEEGFLLAPNHLYSNYNYNGGGVSCCALGAAAIEGGWLKSDSINNDNGYGVAMAFLGIETDEKNQLIDGFDCRSAVDGPMGAIGARLRADYCDIEE